MEAYEEKLHMIERFQRLQALCEETSTLCQDASLSREELAAGTEEKLQLMLQAISQD